MDINSRVNKMSKRGAKTPTNRALKASIKELRSQINPAVRSYVVRTNPKPIRAQGSVWIPRKFRVFLTQAGTSVVDFASVTIGSVVSAGLPPSTKFRILRYGIWNTTNSRQNSGYIEANYDHGSSGYSGVASIDVSDTGTAVSLPGVGIEIPRSLSVPISGSSTSSTVLLSVRTGRSGVSVDTAATQNIVIDVEGELAV